MGSDPSYPASEEYILSLPFKGMMNTVRGVAEGYVQIAHAVRYDDGVLVPYPGVDLATTLTMNVAWWTGGTETIIGWIPSISKGNFYIVTDEQIWSPGISASVSTMHSTGPVGTIAANVASAAVVGTNTLFTKDIAPGSMLTQWVLPSNFLGEVLTVTDDTHLTLTANSAYTVAAVAYKPWFKDFQYTTYWRGPRWTHHAGRLVIVGKYGVYASESYSDDYFRMLTNHSAVDVITFAGRPILIGARSFAGSKTVTDVPVTSNLLAWPTRTDNTDWTAYGSGELELLDDGANCHAGAMWGKEAFVFTASGIYQLQQTGLGAGNPIAAIRMPINNYAPPFSNVVTGRKGMYYMSLWGPVMFDGRELIPLYKLAKYRLQAPMQLPIAYGWYNPLWESVHFLNTSTSGPAKYVIQEDPLGIVEGDMSEARACNYHITGAGWHFNQPYLANETVIINGVGTDVAARVRADTDTVTFEDEEIWGSVLWAGIVGKEGPSINKVIKKIWVTYEGGIAAHNVLGYEILPDGGSVDWGSLDGSATLTVADSILTVALDPKGLYSTLAAPSWSFALEIPPRVKIYQVRIEYNVAGHV